jgi:hypothetical protein
VITALERDADRMSQTGRVLVAAAAGAAYGLTDTDGRMPKPLALENV